MSLNFGAVSSFVQFSIGNVANLGNGAFTIMALWKPAGNSGIVGGLAAAVERQAYLMDTLLLFGTGDFSSGFPGIVNGDWMWLGISKPAGAAHYRFHLRDYTTSGAWSHGESVGSANHSDPGVSDNLRVGSIPSQAASLGDVAVAAIWTSVVADLAIQSACTTKLTDLIAAAPGWAVRFMQSAPTNIQDLIGSGNETTRSGTITASADPPGFDFSLSSAQGGWGVLL